MILCTFACGYVCPKLLRRSGKLRKKNRHRDGEGVNGDGDDECAYNVDGQNDACLRFLVRL